MNENIIRRIKALMAKAESTAHPAEAEALMEKAEALIVQHSIELQWLTEDGQKLSNVVSKQWDWHDYKAIGKRRLVCSLADAIPGVYALYGIGRARGHHFVAVWADDPIKLEMIDSVLVQAELALSFWWKSFDASIRNGGGYYAKKNNYLWGFGAGAGRRFNKLTSAQSIGDEKALVLVNATRRVKEHVRDELNIKSKTVKDRARTMAGFYDGLTDGQEADLGGRTLER